MKKVADYVIRHHYANLDGDDGKYLRLLQEVVARTARLVAKWQLVGFVHGAGPITTLCCVLLRGALTSSLDRVVSCVGDPRGARCGLGLSWSRRVVGAREQRVGAGVLNTDNMSILGVTIDFGPYGFLDKFDPMWTPNLTDFQGRRCARSSSLCLPSVLCSGYLSARRNWRASLALRRPQLADMHTGSAGTATRTRSRSFSGIWPSWPPRCSRWIC